MPFLVQIEQLHCDSRSRSTRARNRTRPQWHPPSRVSSIASSLARRRPFVAGLREMVLPLAAVEEALRRHGFGIVIVEAARVDAVVFRVRARPVEGVDAAMA